MDHPAIAAVAIAFWIFVGVTAVAGMILDYRKRKLALEPLRIAIEHGEKLDPEIITRLLGREERHEAVNPQGLKGGGISTCAAGGGVALLSVFVAQVHPPHHWIVLGIGVLAVCVGIGLIIAAGSLRK